MIPASLLLQEAARYSQTLSVQVDIYRGSTPLHLGVPVVDGSIKSDRTGTIRLNADVTLAFTEYEATGIDTRRCSFRISRGVESLGYVERSPMGRFRVDDVSRDELGLVQLSGSGRETYVVDARFLQPRTPPRGQSTVKTITDLIKEALPSARVRQRNTQDRPVTATAPWEMERFEAIQALADSIQAEVYSDYTGDFIIADVPDLVNGVPVYVVNEGDAGVLISRSEKDTRDTVYNAMSVHGSSSDPNVLPVWGWAYDDDPTSETYYYANPDGPGGGFGQVPKFYASQFFTADSQCEATARSMLAYALAGNRSLSFSSIPLAFLETGDLVQVDMFDGTKEIHLLEKSDCSLDVGGGMKFDTLASKIPARIGTVVPPVDPNAGAPVFPNTGVFPDSGRFLAV